MKKQIQKLFFLVYEWVLKPGQEMATVENEVG